MFVVFGFEMKIEIVVLCVHFVDLMCVLDAMITDKRRIDVYETSKLDTVLSLAQQPFVVANNDDL